MTSALGLAGNRVVWIQPRTFAQYYELRADRRVLATMDLGRLASTLGVAETPHGAWHLEQAGLLDNRVLVRDAIHDDQVAVFMPNLLGDGTVQMADGRRLRWEPTNFWATDWHFVDELGNVPIAFKAGVDAETVRDIFKTQATLRVDATSWTERELTLLAVLGWYLILHRQRQAGAAVAATAAT